MADGQKLGARLRRLGVQVAERGVEAATGFAERVTTTAEEIMDDDRGALEAILDKAERRLNIPEPEIPEAQEPGFKEMQ